MAGVDKCLYCYKNTRGSVCCLRKMAEKTLTWILVAAKMPHEPELKSFEKERRIKLLLSGYRESECPGFVDDWKVVLALRSDDISKLIKMLVAAKPDKIDIALLCSLCRLYSGPIIDDQ